MAGNLLILLAFLLVCYAGYEIFVRPFGYATLVYVCDLHDFNAAPERISAKFGIGHNIPTIESPWTKNLKSLAFHDRIREAVAISRQLQAQGSADGKPLTARDLFLASSGLLRLCSETAKIFVALMESAGTPARVVWMRGHTTAEVFDPATGWVLVDPYGNIMVRHAGRYLSVIETIGQTDLEAVALTDSAGKDFARSGYLKKKHSAYRANDCIVVIDHADLFDFQNKLFNPIALLRSLAGKPAIARGMQFTGGSRPKLGNFGMGIYRRFLKSRPLRYGEVGASEGKQ